MTEAELAAIEERTVAATPGPWTDDAEVEERNGGGTRLYVSAHNDGASGHVCRVTPIVEGSYKRWAQENMAEPKRHEADARFIAHARFDIPALVKEVRRLLKHEAKLGEWVQRLLALGHRDGCSEPHGPVPCDCGFEEVRAEFLRWFCNLPGVVSTPR
jgi:hypothetical protein